MFREQYFNKKILSKNSTCIHKRLRESAISTLPYFPGAGINTYLLKHYATLSMTLQQPKDHTRKTIFPGIRIE